VRYVVDGKAPASADEREIKRAELHELRFASNNVNQIAHHLHTSALTGCAPPSDDEIMTSLSAMHAVATARVIDRAIFIVKKRLKS
jgi:polynucleotide 5'-kinase involved in rRNA processing